MNSEAIERTEFTTKSESLLDLLLQHNPLLGTLNGFPGPHDGCLPPTDQDVRGQLLANIDAELSNLEQSAGSSMPNDDRIDVELAAAGISGMKIFESALRPTERDPNWYIDNVAFGLYSLLIRVDMPREEKTGFLLGRLNSVEGHLRSGMDQIKRSARVLIETAVDNARGTLDFCGQSLTDFIETVPDETDQRGLLIAQQNSQSAIRDFTDFIERLDGTEDFAIGKPAFNDLLKETHLIEYDADQLLELGNRVVKEIENELEEFSLENFGHGQWWTAVEGLSAHHPSNESLMAVYCGMLDDARWFAEERGLVDFSAAAEIDVEPTPPFARGNLPFAAYIPVPPFARSGRAKFWVTTPADDMTEDATNKALEQHHLGRILVACVHEGYPGHHLQFSNTLGIDRPFRHIFASTVFMEGWALYCEDLMRREGFKVEDPLNPLLQISQMRDQLWRALRIVLDVGLHCGGMTQREATGLLVDKHVLDPSSAASEVMYYCSAPTQPMSYMVGKLLLEELIEKCRADGSDRFKSLYDIHNQILKHGSMPFPLLEKALGLHSV